MADMLTIGSNASNAFKRAIEVTSHNVSNMGTEGYNRQRAEFSSNTPAMTGGGFLGAGVRVSTIERVYASYIQDQLVNTNTMKERYTEQLNLSQQIEGIVAGNDEGVQKSMQTLFDNFQNLSNNTTNPTSRRQVIESVGNMESMLSNLSNVLKESEKQVNNQIEDLSTEINNRLLKINELNKQISGAVKVGVQAPNDLLDQRDQAIKELSGYMDIKTFRQQDGRIDIHTGDGRYPLISDNTLTTVSTKKSDFTDDNRTEVFLRLGNRDVNISDSVMGGQLGGVLDFRRNMLDGAMNDLGMTLNGLVASSNWQHYQGYDLNGNVGREIFSELEANVMADRDNVRDGSAIRVSFNPLDSTVAAKPPYDPVEPGTYAEKNGQLQTAFDAIGQFKAQNYEIRVVEGQYEFFAQPSGEQITPTVDPGNPDIFQIDGLQFDLSGHTKIDGDRFLVKPHRDILDQLEQKITNSEDLATRGQSAIPSFPDLKDRLGVTTNDLDNTDPANTINGVTLRDRFDQLFGNTPTSRFDAVDTSGDGIITRAEYEDAVTGIDQLAVPKPAGEGDNTNIANMASFQSKKLLFSDESGEATESLLGGYSAMSANVGMYVRGTEIQMTAQENTYDQIEKRRESMSGVNLDEEAANLMKYQQAYQASAQIIQTSQTLFQSLLGAVRL
ncbi:flagellar hook-associated protein FlgK [Thiomicrospira sp. WB1]|uniref:flagellar hook-associated protein FlgK n=1 Tax=Thiomicrospira sp. WB1 TaxID=1685380 RepID=UPI00074893B2|nr:flagellar hook-associated protein FlgK [Thiomicrospira sp. WB1]KUJ71610.1 hypothetical protein AVO41_08845 [Thiomicrospira sp. WB1]